MNYIELIRRFWRSHNEHSFNTTEIALYFHLLEVCNICHWKNRFKRNNSKIGADLGISFNTLKKARNRLAQCNLISFETRNGSPNVVYTLSNFDKVSAEVSTEVGNEVSTEVGNEVWSTKDKHKQNNISFLEKKKQKSPREAFEDFEDFKTSKQEKEVSEELTDPTQTFKHPGGGADKSPKKREKPLKPSLIDFIEYGYTKAQENNLNPSESLKTALKLKYTSWEENGWKDGNNKSILNWKSKLLNTLPYIVNSCIGNAGFKGVNDKELPKFDINR